MSKINCIDFGTDKFVLVHTIRACRRSQSAAQATLTLILNRNEWLSALLGSSFIEKEIRPI
jgi:hypothetical protein